MSQENENRDPIIKGQEFSFNSFFASFNESKFDFCFIKFVLFTAITYSDSFVVYSSIEIVFRATSKTFAWPPLPSYETTDTSAIFLLLKEISFKFSDCKKCNNLCECFFIELTESKQLTVVEFELLLTFLIIFWFVTYFY